MRFADLALARRLETTDALASVEFARAWVRLNSYTGEAFIPVAGGHASFGGIDSPLTQAFGLGLNGPVTEADMAGMEEFYRAQGAAVNIETCPLADPSLLKLLNERGYRPIEYSNVLAREITGDDSLACPDPASNVQVRRLALDDAESYSLLIGKSFFENTEISTDFLSFFTSTFHAAGAFFFLAEVDGVQAGGGMMSIHQGVASLGGAGTLPEFRNRGAQKAVLLARLALAAQSGCDLAMVATMPGSGSQRNVERQGFRVVYTRTKFSKQKAVVRSAKSEVTPAAAAHCLLRSAFCLLLSAFCLLPSPPLIVLVCPDEHMARASRLHRCFHCRHDELSRGRRHSCHVSYSSVDGHGPYPSKRDLYSRALAGFAWRDGWLSP
jgi:ribosomal protein S18 acetylase RimI-like enzyme